MAFEFWVRLNGGDWNGNPSADPATDVGGISLAGVGSATMYPIVQGSQNTVVANFGASGFAGTPPSGFTAGWPAGGGGFTTLDPSKFVGPGGLSGGNLTFSGGGSTSFCQAADGYSTGKYYFELTNVFNDFFTSGSGGGAGRSYPGIDPNFWTGAKCSYNVSDVNGGGGVIGGALGDTFTAEVDALGSTAVSSLGELSNGSVLGFAFKLGSAPPPPPTPTPAVAIPLALGGWRGLVGINWQGLALVGDAYTGVVGLSDFTIFKEYGNQMMMLATTPPLHKDRKRISIPRFEIEVEAGLGIPGQPTVAPLMQLDYSKDGGITWVPLQVFRSMGAAGEYIKRLRWINLGNSRTWIFRMIYTDTARPSIIGTYFDSFTNLG